MGFVHWVGSLFSAGARTLHNLYDKVHSAITTLWHLLETLGHLVGKAWGRFHDAMDHLGGMLADLAEATYRHVRNLLTVVIPNAVRWAVGTAERFAQRIVHDLYVWTLDAVRAVEHWARALIHDLRVWTTDAVRWLRTLIADLRRDLTALVHALRHVLHGPEVAVAWLFAALVRHVQRWLRDNAEVFTRYFVRHAVGMLLRNLSTVERIVTDVF